MRSRNTIEVEGVDVELGSRVGLEQAATHTGIKPIYWVISSRETDA